jgi:hypothetical protein
MSSRPSGVTGVEGRRALRGVAARPSLGRLQSGSGRKRWIGNAAAPHASPLGDEVGAPASTSHSSLLSGCSPDSQEPSQGDPYSEMSDEEITRLLVDELARLGPTIEAEAKRLGIRRS